MSFYNQNTETNIVVDASPYEFDAILTRKQKSGEFRPVALSHIIRVEHMGLIRFCYPSTDTSKYHKVTTFCHHLYLFVTFKQCFTEFVVFELGFHTVYMSVPCQIPTCDLIGH